MKCFMLIVLMINTVLFATTSIAKPDDTTDVVVIQAKSDREEGAGVGDRITLTVQNFSKFLETSINNKKHIVLFINSMMLKDIFPEAIDTFKGEVRFQLLRTVSTKEIWNALLGKPTRFIKEITVSIGEEDGYPVFTKVHDFKLIVIRKSRFFLFLVVFIIILYLLILLARKSEILRDSGQKPETSERSYSLARTQMAFWFLLVISSYLFIWVITWEDNSVSDSILALIGISAGTALGATAIDVRTGKPGEAPISPKENFFKDILSDENGISLHRFQMVSWTIVLGIIFISSVYRNLAMPEFSGTLLTLMGISSGTYLGFKIPENVKKSERDAQIEPAVDIPPMG